MVVAIGAAAALTVTDASANPCPIDSKDRWFTYSLDAKYCIIGSVEGNAPNATQDRYYNVYCPGRMTKANAVQVGRALVNGTLAIPSNRIRIDYDVPYKLVPKIYGEGTQYTEKSIAHLGHYNCQRPGTPNGVATHFKLHVIASPTAPEIANHAVLKNQSGTIGPGKNLDREYFLKVHMKSIGRASMPEAVGRILLTRDAKLRQTLANRQARLCVMDSTDIQCAPCATSDKLIVRSSIVEKGRSCPPGARYWIESDRSSSHPNGYPDPIP
jgi:hypothetical protein